MKVAVIGAGIAGLAAAVRLRCKGYEVEVYEVNDFVGGKLSEFQLGAYRFDAGPSLFTMPHFVEELFALAGKDVRQYFEYQALTTVCQYFWQDGTRLTAWADHDRYADEVERVLGVKGDVLRETLAQAAFKYEATKSIFLEKSLHKISTYLSADVLRVLTKFHKLDIFKTMNDANEQLLKHPKLVQLFNRYATYNGSNPYEASAILTMIPHLEHGIGAYLPKGGMVAITQSIYTLAQELGVQFHFSTRVDEIQVQGGNATGVRIGDEWRAYDKVVCNMDVFFAYDKLLPTQPRPNRILSQPKSSSALIFYWGIKRQFAELNVHNIFFADDYRREFEAIFQHKTLHDDPTIYINITSKGCPDDAPADGENWFVMINTPSMAVGQDWDELIRISRARIVEKLSRMLQTDIEPLIEVEEVLEPRTIQSRTQSHLGALYGTSSNNKMAAFWRHPNFAKSIRNLYFCGGSVHPGGGIPLCLLSARIVSDLVE